MPHEPWQDTSLPPSQRVADLLSRMTLEEKVSQLYGVWVGVDADGEAVAPHQHDLSDPDLDWQAVIAGGLGQLTRPFGTAPVDPAVGARVLAKTQTEIAAANRFGIPAVAHEECLTGFMTWQATTYPTPLAWGATFDPDLVQKMAEQIGTAMRAVGIHQGLAPVVDVSRDSRWGRTEETIGEDPHLVGTIGAAYVRGLESTGIIATLKHFAGYSASRAGRNHGPTGFGPRELADVLLPPFELALREGGARSVMAAYTDVDGVPAHAALELLTHLLREDWGFSGTLVADYFGISFLEVLYGVAGSTDEAAALALAAGVDIELPTMRCYGEPLLQAVRSGAASEELVDRAATRVLLQKCELGLLDPDWAKSAAPPDGPIVLDPPENRALARRLAEESVVLLANDGGLPLAPDAEIALVGPVADEPMAMLGCYTLPSHVQRHHPEVPLGVDIPSVLQALRAELPAAGIKHVAAGTVESIDEAGIAEAVSAASAAQVCVAVLGDRSGLFGNGTSGEGCDAEELRLPGQQEQLLEALLATGTPVVLVLLAGRPYALGSFAGRLAGIVQTFFPGEEGGPAIAGVLSGRSCPSGRLPVSVPRVPGGQPAPYLSPRLGRRTDVSNIDPTALFPFGHGLSYTSFAWEAPPSDPDPAEVVEIPTDGSLTASVVVRNTGERAGTEVVQLYLHDPVAQVSRPVVQLIGYARVTLEPGEARLVTFEVHADLTSFTGRGGRRVVEPGDIELRLGPSSGEARHVVRARLTGPERVVGADRRMTAGTRAEPLDPEFARP
ncbi:beta-xylosidase/alpha-l-arabinosidase [Flindersiella endophytica]